MALNRFTPDELAFFVRPRAWPDIIARFGSSGEEIRDKIIAADNTPPPNGGAGFLRWVDPAKSWVLTSFGRVYVQQEGMDGILEMSEAWFPPPAPLKPLEEEKGEP
jgi:hypothetical protein